jgi:hypothetical protein
MIKYVSNIIPRIKAFSESLDRMEIFLEAPWVMIDENGNQQKYIFRRNGELIMSMNGTVTIGRWEYISAAKSLLINRVKDTILLNQDFVDHAVMILRLDGRDESKFILANDNVIPDLDVAKYLKELYYTRNEIRIVETTDGVKLEVADAYYNYLAVSIDGIAVPDGIMNYQPKRRIIVEKGCIKKILLKTEYKSDKGIIEIESDANSVIQSGDLVFLNEAPAPDGKYRIGLFNSVVVLNGRVA